jgi:tripartite-type tricarboxylate transporter receptor subunit TctC
VAPEYPTVAEAGVPGYEHASWVGLLAPAKTPQAIIARLNREAAQVLNVPDVKTVYLRDGLETVGDSPQEFAAVIRTEVAKWTKVVKAAGIRAE